MPLHSVDGTPKHGIPRKRLKTYRRWRRNLSDADYQRAVEGIRSRCQGQEFVVSSFLPGKVWTYTEFQPLYVATGRNEQFAGWFFGLIVWETMIADADLWYFLPADKDEDDVIGMRYFRAKKNAA